MGWSRANQRQYRPPEVHPVGPGQESVWDYPRPPRAEHVERRAVLRHGGVAVADTTDLVRVLETSHPPTYYLPRSAFGEYLQPVEKTTFCEWKGTARYVDVLVPGCPPLREVAGGIRLRIAVIRSSSTGWPCTRARSTR